jgi:uncharacterized membrane protein
MSIREFTTAPARPAAGGGAPADAPVPQVFDPLRYCIFTTLALLAWLVGPVVMVAITSVVGLAAYWKAWREGLTRSRCVLGDTRLVMGYLGLALVGSVVVLLRR